MTVPMVDYRILLVEDEPADREIFQRTVNETSRFDIQLRSCDNSSSAEKLLADERFDVLFLDHRLPDQDGLSFFRELQEKDAMVPPAFLISSYGSETLVSQWHRIGGTGYLPKEDLEPQTMEDLLESLENERSTPRFDDHRSQRDPITDLHNRRFLINYLETAVDEARPADDPLTVLLVHFDGLREIREEHGPDAECEKLKKAGELLRRHVSMHGRCGRYDGDLFWTILPGISRASATKKGTQLLGNVQGFLATDSHRTSQNESNVAGVVTNVINDVTELIEKVNECLRRARNIPGQTVLLHDWRSSPPAESYE